MKDFKDKVAVVTGAASGIGRAIAERCAQEGMKVVLADIEESALALAESELKATGAQVLAVRTDVARASDVEALAQETQSAFGAVHLLFNNAGVEPSEGWAWEDSISDWEWVLGVNLWGVIHGIRVFVPIMLKQDADCYIVNTASLAGLVTYPSEAIYKVTKTAVVSLSETLYHELQQIGAKVHVSVFCPSIVRTRLGQSARNRPAGTSQTPTTTYSNTLDTELAQAWLKRWQAEAPIDAQQAVDVLFSAIRDERFYVLTHPQYNEQIRVRADDILEGRNPTSSFRFWLDHRDVQHSQAAAKDGPDRTES